MPQYRTVLSAYRGDPGFLSGVANIAKRIAMPVLRAVPGVGGVISAVEAARGIVQGGSRPAAMPGGGMPTANYGAQPTAAQRARGVVATGVSPLGTVGVRFKQSRRMNAGNAKAARRAIRRIKSVRHLLQSIERELPRRPAKHIGGSRGVITRSEAARALRS